MYFILAHKVQCTFYINFISRKNIRKETLKMKVLGNFRPNSFAHLGRRAQIHTPTIGLPRPPVHWPTPQLIISFLILLSHLEFFKITSWRILCSTREVFFNVRIFKTHDSENVTWWSREKRDGEILLLWYFGAKQWALPQPPILSRAVHHFEEPR